MSLAFADADRPSLDAVFTPGLDPSSMQGCRKWKEAKAVELQGFNGGSAQGSRVSALWNKDWLFFKFTCSDRTVVAPGTEDGLDHFRLGDTAEIFVARRDDKSYAEIHATPTGRKTVYFCRDYRQPADPPDTAGKICVIASKSPSGWCAFVAVPRDLFGRAEVADEYDIFFGRYDYENAAGKSVLSSYPTQHGDKPDFHRRDGYAIMRLKP